MLYLLQIIFPVWKWIFLSRKNGTVGTYVIHNKYLESFLSKDIQRNFMKDKSIFFFIVLYIIIYLKELQICHKAHIICNYDLMENRMVLWVCVMQSTQWNKRLTTLKSLFNLKKIVPCDNMAGVNFLFYCVTQIFTKLSWK